MHVPVHDNLMPFERFGVPYPQRRVLIYEREILITASKDSQIVALNAGRVGRLTVSRQEGTYTLIAANDPGQPPRWLPDRGRLKLRSPALRPAFIGRRSEVSSESAYFVMQTRRG